MKYLLNFCMTLLLTTSAAIAQTVTLIVPNPVGSQGDSLMRIIQEEYNQLPDRKMVIENAPGGHHVVAANRFLSSSDPYVILNGSATLNVFNPLVMKDLPYADRDFRHISFVGGSATFLVSSRRYTDLKDLVTKLPGSDRPLVAGYASAHDINLYIMQGQGVIDPKVGIVNYKGAPQLLTDILGNHIDAGITGITEAMVQAARAGNIRLLGNSTNQDLDLDGISVPSISQTLKVPQMTSGFFLTAKANADPKFVSSLETDIRTILARPDVRARMKRIHVIGDPIMGHDAVQAFVQNQRQTAKAYAHKIAR